MRNLAALGDRNIQAILRTERPVVTSLASAGLGLVLTMAVALSGRLLRGTTLVGPWLWGVVSAILLTATALWKAAHAADGNRYGPLLRFGAEVSTLCPVVALLGARRPQHAAWQFVVATLFVILLVPAVQGGQTGGIVIIDAPWSWFVLALAGAGFVNSLPTRYWPAAVSMALAQFLLLAPSIAGESAAAWSARSPRLTIAIALLNIGVFLLRWRAGAVRQNAAWLALDPLDRLWLEFRDAYGVLWALRVQQRVNAAADQFGWPVALAWDGFYDRALGKRVNSIPPASRAAVEHVLRTLLWRFFSPAWIDEQMSPK